MYGQLSLFDIQTGKGKRKPCEYDFLRYIGQKVELWRLGKVGVITKIEPYYTYVLADGEEFVGTPTTICPVDKKEYR